MKMGYREYARHRGCALSAVQKALKTGRIGAVEGKIDSEDADQRWAASTDPAKRRKEAPAPPAPAVMPLVDGVQLAAPPMTRQEWPASWYPTPMPAPAAAPLAPPAPVGMDTFLAAKTERERAEAELAKIKLAEALGRLLDAEEARQTWQAIGAMFARSREMVPVALATKLVGKSEPKEIERIIRAEFRESDRKIADEIEARFADRVGDVRSLAS